MSEEKVDRSKEEIDEDVNRLQEWLWKQPHLPHDVDVSLLRPFVTGTKSLETAKHKLDAWFTVRSKSPQLFKKDLWDPLSQDFQLKSKAVKMFFSPELTESGHLVHWHTTGEDFSQFDYPQWLARSVMQVELAMVKRPQSRGLICVYNVEGLPAGVLAKITTSHTVSVLQWLQSTLPIRLKKVLFVNSPPIISIILNTFGKPFMKEKVFQRFQILTDGMEVLNKHLPKEVIPSDFGGTSKTSSALNEEWTKLMEDEAEWFRMTSELGSDESKRPPDSEDTYGVQGTFRSLTID